MFNVLAAVGVYWLARVPKGGNKEERVKVVKGKQVGYKVFKWRGYS